MFDYKTALEFTAQIPDLLQSAKSGSLIEYTRSTRVEPITLVDMRAAQLPYIEDVLNSGLNIFSAYYLQAVALSVNVGNVDVVKLLDKLNPNRDVGAAGASAAADAARYYSEEAFEKGLPFVGQHQYTQESDVSGGPGGRSISTINENANLSVGKLLEVNVESEGRKATFPIQVRLIVNTIRPDVMAHTLSLGSKDTSIKERYHQWRSGQIRFIQDLILCQDLIDEHKSNSMNDHSGYYKERSSTKKKNSLAGLLTRNPSVATASSIMVMTTDTASELEGKIRGRLSRFKDREKIFKESSAMMFFVIDPDYEQVTIYHRSIERPTEVSIRELQRANKRGGGPDITEILNAFRQSKSPSI